MHLSNSELSLVAIAALTLALLALILAAAGATASRRKEEASALPQGDRLEMLVENQAKQIRRLEGAMRQLAGGERKLAELLQGTIQQRGRRAVRRLRGHGRPAVVLRRVPERARRWNCDYFDQWTAGHALLREGGPGREQRAQPVG